MAFKLVLLAAFVAVASAGGPAIYDIAASSGDHSSIGFSQESTQKGYGGQNVISSYTKSDDSAHSFVRVSSHSISNDALLKYDVAHAPIVKTAYAAPAYIAPTAAPLIAKAYAEPYSYSAPLLTKAYASPYSYGSSLLTKTYAAPAPYIAKAAIAAPAPLLTKAYAAPIAAAPLLTKTYADSIAAAPLLTKTYAAPIASAPLLTKTYADPIAAAPLLTKTYADSIAAAPLLTKTYAAPIAAAPLLTKSYAAPLLTKSYEYAAHAPIISKSALIAPAHGYAASLAPAPLLTKTYAEASAPVVHTVFNGLGTSYAW